MVENTQTIIDWSRYYIPDSKTRTKSIRGELIGFTDAPVGTRDVFYIKRSPIASVYLYVDPYEFSSTATFTGADSNSKVFLWAPSTLSCTFSDGQIDTPLKPTIFTNVYADYEYVERTPFTYTDGELASYLQAAVGYLNNTYNLSFTMTGTISTLETNAVTDNNKELVARALAVVTRRKFLDEQRSRGFGVMFKGPLQVIDSVQAAKEYNAVTKELEKAIQRKIDNDEYDSIGQGQIIDVYSEEVVDT